MENMVIYIQHDNKFHKFHIQHGNLFQQNEDMKKKHISVLWKTSMFRQTGWWYTYPSEKYESQLGLLFPIYEKIKKFQTTNQQKNFGA